MARFPLARKSLLACAILASTVAIAFGVAWPYRFTRAPYYEPRQTWAVSTPVMTMDEYGGVVSTHLRPYILHGQSRTGPGALVLFGISDHTNDPAHPDIQRLISEWNDFKPTVALTESRLGLYVGGFDGGVQMFGESGGVYALARSSGTPLYTLELPLEDEIAGVLEKFSPEQTALFYILRPYFGARASGPLGDPADFVEEYIKKRGDVAGLAGSIRTVEDIDRIWKRDFPNQPGWRDSDGRHGHPGYLSALAARANAVRNDHWMQVFLDLASANERVFAVCGCSHVVRLEPALRPFFNCTLNAAQ
jgi:hypothetical protein